MRTSTLTRPALTVAMSAALASMSFASHAQQGQEDGYYGRRTYGASAKGSNSLLGTVLNMILNLQPRQ